jgi:cellulose biosynthesis protein BcsQ
MKIIVVFNMRGGIGKTTLAVTLAEGLAQFGGAKVLIADADPQRSASHRLCPLATVNECGLPGSGRNISKYLSDAIVKIAFPILQTTFRSGAERYTRMAASTSSWALTTPSMQIVTLPVGA